MNITSEQCRAARALLNWPQLELAKRSKVSSKTVADFENGVRCPYAATLTVLRSTLEAGGVEFTDAIEEVCGAGVRFKWGNEPKKAASKHGASNQDGDQSGVDACAWDDDFEAYTADAPATPYIIPITDADRAVLRQRFAESPEAWNKLSDRAKAVYSRELGL